MAILAPLYAGPFGTNLATVPFDLSTGRIWMAPSNENSVGAQLNGGPLVLATVSGHTMLTDTTTCWTCGGGGASSFKVTSSPDQNQSACLSIAGSDPCAAEGVPGSPVGVNRWTFSPSCTIDPPFGQLIPTSMFWQVSIGSQGSANRLLFTISTLVGACGDTLAAFIGATDSLCFPLTLSNLIPSGVVGTALGPIAGIPNVIRYGHSGSVTLTLTDCDCP